MNIAPAMAGRTARVDALTDAAINRSVQIVCGAGLVSGKEIVCLLLARGLRDAGWNPEFMTSRWSDVEFVRQALIIPRLHHTSHLLRGRHIACR